MKNYDYAQPGYYFVTICTKDKQCLFGSPEHLNQYGQVAQWALDEIEKHTPYVRVEKSVVMPNHIHVILVLTGNTSNLSTVVGQYKSAVTRVIHTTNKAAEVWQSSFHDHVIRNQKDYERIWAYIDANPARWKEDCFYIPQTE